MPGSIQGAEKGKAKQAHIPGGILADDLRCDGRGLTGYEAGRGRRRSWDSEIDNLIGAQNVGRSDTSTDGADIEGFGEFNEFGARSIRPANENGNLKANARRKPR